MTPEQAIATLPVSAGYQLLLMIVSVLGVIVGTLASISIKLLSARFTKVETAVDKLTTELQSLDKTVSSSYVTRSEMQSENTKLMLEMREDRKEIIAALKEVTGSMGHFVKRDDCVRLHGNGGNK